MASAKDIVVAPIAGSIANKLVSRLHYSQTYVRNSQLHLGVFLDGRLEGVMQFGPSTDKRKLIGLVSDTEWNSFIELNRMAFSDALPRNSESRALAVAFRLMRKAYPHLKWVISFADACQSGDGTIYRASGFVLTGIKKNAAIWGNDKGDRVALATVTKEQHILKTGASSMAEYRKNGFKPIDGFQLRYVYFLDKSAAARLTVPVLPFDIIEQKGAGMYLGKRVSRGKQAMA